MPLFQDVTGQYLGWLKYTMTRTSINPSPQYQRFPLVGGFAPFRQQWWQLNGSSTGKCQADSPKDANHRCGMRRHARLKACAKEVDQQDCCMTQQIPQKRVVKVSKWFLHVFFGPSAALVPWCIVPCRDIRDVAMCILIGATGPGITATGEARDSWGYPPAGWFINVYFIENNVWILRMLGVSPWLRKPPWCIMYIYIIM